MASPSSSMAGLHLSTDTVSVVEPLSMVTTLSVWLTTLYGPSYAAVRGAR